MSNLTITQQSNATTLAASLLKNNSGITIIEGTEFFTGVTDAAGTLDEFIQTVAGSFTSFSLPKGIVLSTGSIVNLPLVNSSDGYGGDNFSAGSSELLSYVQASLGVDVATSANNAAILDFSFTTANDGEQSIVFNIAFGSDEYPEFADSFVDIAVVVIDGVNYALFDNEVTKPLTVTQVNIDNGYFIPNDILSADLDGNILSSALPIEYDGVSRLLKITAPLDSSKTIHTVRIGIADTNDALLDSAVFVGEMEIISGGSNGEGDLQSTIDDTTLDALNYLAKYLADPDFLERLLNDELTDKEFEDFYNALDNAGLEESVFEELGSYMDQANTWEDEIGVNDSIYLFDGDDEAFGGIGNDKIFGGGGDDILDGGIGADILDGGTGDDTYFLDSTADKVIEKAGEGDNDTVRLNDSFKTFSLAKLGELENLSYEGGTLDFTGTGNAKDNQLTGGTGKDFLDGGGGDDTLDGGDDDNNLNGGAGTDKVLLKGNLSDYTISVIKGKSSSKAFFTATGLSATDIIVMVDNDSGHVNKLAGIENIVFEDDDSTVAVDGSTESSLLYNVATYKDDTLTGTSANDIINGGQGNDSIDGGAGDDTMTGGDGNDTFIVDSVGDVMVELTGKTSGSADLIKTTLTTYTLGDNLEKLVFTGIGDFNGTGNALANSITGGAGNDMMNGGLGKDTMTGLAGNDTYYVNDKADKIVETEGVDTVMSSIAYVLDKTNLLENLTLTGSVSLKGTGNTIANILIGNDGVNALDGKEGNDTITGGAGADTLLGGVGNDTIIYDSADVKIDGGAGDGDTLKFGASDETLDLSQLPTNGISGIEIVDLTGVGNNHLVVNVATLQGITGKVGHDLYVIGDAGDDVSMTSSIWSTPPITEVVGGSTYQHYSSGTGTTAYNLFVLEAVTQTLI